MYLFVLVLIFALLVDARAAAAPRVERTRPAEPGVAAPAPTPVPAPAALILAVVGGTQPTGGSEFGLRAPLDIGRDAACDIAIPSHFVLSVTPASAASASSGWWKIGQH